MTLPERRDFCFGSKFSTPRLRETFFNRCGAFAIERHWARSRFDNPKQHFRGLVLIRWRELTDLGNRTIEELGHERTVSNLLRPRQPWRFKERDLAFEPHDAAPRSCPVTAVSSPSPPRHNRARWRPEEDRGRGSCRPPSQPS